MFVLHVEVLKIGVKRPGKCLLTASDGHVCEQTSDTFCSFMVDIFLAVFLHSGRNGRPGLHARGQPGR